MPIDIVEAETSMDTKVTAVCEEVWSDIPTGYDDKIPVVIRLCDRIAGDPVVTHTFAGWLEKQDKDAGFSFEDDYKDLDSSDIVLTHSHWTEEVLDELGSVIDKRFYK